MKGVILCAGYGERLRPLTDSLPKPLFPIVGHPIIDNIIAYLKQVNITEICVNTHHLAHKLSQYLTSKSFGIKIHNFYESSLLGVAGGIGSMREYLQEMFIVCNCDVLTNLDLKPAIEFHKRENSIITLILHDYKELNKIALSSTHNIISIDKSVSPDRLAFTGISIMSPEIFDFLPYKEYGDILKVYDKLIPKKLKGYIAKGCHTYPLSPIQRDPLHQGHQGYYWIDIGTHKNYLKAHEDILINKVSTLFWESPRGSTSGAVFSNIYIGNGSYVSPLAQLKGFVSIGNNCKINENARLENCVVWDNIEIPGGKTVNNTIIYENLQK